MFRICCTKRLSSVRRSFPLLALLLGVLTQMPMYAATTTATVSANIVEPVGLEVENDLTYSVVAGKQAGGVIQLAPSTAKASAGGISVETVSAGKPARFTVQGKPNATYSIRLPESVMLTDARGNTLKVDGFTSLPATSGVTDASGQQSLSVGARLNLEDGQVQGPYAGQMVIIIEYN